MIDGLRGTAVLALVASMLAVPGVRGGWIGLEVLFAVAGFRVAEAVLAAAADGRARRTVIRRTVVLAVQVVGVVGVAAGWSMATDGTLTAPVRAAIGASLSATYNVASVTGEPDARAFAELWSVGVAVQVSLVIAAVILSTRRWATRRRAAVFAGAAVAVVAGRWVAGAGSTADPAAVVLSWFRADGMLIGAAGALWARAVSLDARRRLHDLAPFGLVWLAAAVAVLPERSAWIQHNQLLALPLAALATTLVLVAVRVRTLPTGLTRVLGSAPLRLVGARWVAVVLVAHPVGAIMIGDGAGWQGWAHAAGQLAFVAFGAWASFELIERPVGALLRRPRALRPAAALG